MKPQLLSNYVNGKFIVAPTIQLRENTNPSNSALLSHFPESTVDEVDVAVEAALSAQSRWEKRTTVERAAFLRRLAVKIRANRERLARVIVAEQGKVAALARSEVDLAASYLDYMAEWARRIEGDIIDSDRPNEDIFLFWKPLGVAVGILPWNFPFFLIVRKMAPALLTGNTIVIKPSEETPNNCYEFCRLVHECEFPAGVFNVVFGGGASVGNALSRHNKVDIISFTGSVETGKEIMRCAADNITKVNLELGGKAPAIVLKDADLDVAVGSILKSRIINSGQVCNCAERVYVEKDIAKDFENKMAEEMRSLRLGDPSISEDIDMGPLINEKGIEKVSALVDAAKADNARVVTGGMRATKMGVNFYEPTVLSNCSHSMGVMRQEIFGPVLPIQVVDNLDEALKYSNDSEYGLTSSIYTSNLKSAMRACHELNFGETYVNRENGETMQGYHAGVGRSGIGGADGRHGLYDYMRTHVVYMQS